MHGPVALHERGASGGSAHHLEPVEISRILVRHLHLHRGGALLRPEHPRRGAGDGRMVLPTGRPPQRAPQRGLDERRHHVQPHVDASLAAGSLALVHPARFVSLPPAQALRPAAAMGAGGRRLALTPSAA